MPHFQAYPVLYSFRRCPYAIRARLAIGYADLTVELREVGLKQKPQEMMAISPKGTVPVLQLPNGHVIDESLDIMFWALAQSDPDNWLRGADEAKTLIALNDGKFKYFLDRYKYADRYPEYPQHYYREQGESFLFLLEDKLAQNQYLGGSMFSLVDAAILPFIRQFAAVDNQWFKTRPFVKLNRWLNEFITSHLFELVMYKYPVWNPDVSIVLFKN